MPVNSVWSSGTCSCPTGGLYFIVVWEEEGERSGEREELRGTERERNDDVIKALQKKEKRNGITF